MKYSDYFNTYDTLGTQHSGFLSSMDFSSFLSEIPFLNDLTWGIIDSHLYNELSESIVMKQWARYMSYNKEHARMEIFAQFYTDFVVALAAKLYQKQQFMDLKDIDFRSLSAQDIRTLEHGEKETDRDYGEAKTTRDYDKVEITITREQDTHVIGEGHTEQEETATNKLYPLGASAYVDDTQSITEGSMDSDEQTNTDTWGDQGHTTKARKDEETKDARTDIETIKAYTDTERHTKNVIISPDKYFEIEKELAELNVYNIMKEAVKETMLLSIWEGCDYVWI